jgi:hypothetical protein
LSEGKPEAETMLYRTTEKKMNTRIVVTILALMAMPQTVFAQNAGQQLLGQFNDWSAYSATTDKGKLCFAISQPTRRVPEGLKRGDAYMFVTHRPAEKVRNEISIQVGFPTREGSTADVSIGDKPFKLMTGNERAWSSAENDSAIVQAMRGGSTLSVKSVSGRGNETTDTYSLRGISAALDRIAKECP